MSTLVTTFLRWIGRFFAPPEADFPYLGFLPLPTDKLTAANVPALVRELRRMKNECGLNGVGLEFALTSHAADWKAVLDACQSERMRALVLFGDRPQWDGSSFDLGLRGPFLTACAGHPALTALSLVDEPFTHGIDDAGLRVLYRQVKQLAGQVKLLVGYSRQIWKAEQGQYGAGFGFSDGQCDIAMISSMEFRRQGGRRFFDYDTLVSNHLASRRIIVARAPGVPIWTNAQVFGGDSSYYMPSATEIAKLLAILFSRSLQNAGKLAGIGWQRWTVRVSGALGDSLGDARFSLQREAVKRGKP